MEYAPNSGLESDNKQEKVEVRKKMEAVLFDISLITDDNREVLEDVEAVHRGEAYAEEFIEAVTMLLDEEDFWSNLPEEKKVTVTVHSSSSRVLSSKPLREQLSNLLDEYKGLYEIGD